MIYIYMEKTKQYQNLYKTRDSEHASVLYATKQVLDSSYWENGACFFIFENRDKSEQIIADYYKDKIMVSAKSLMEAIRTIKSIIYSK